MKNRDIPQLRTLPDGGTQSEFIFGEDRRETPRQPRRATIEPAPVQSSDPFKPIKRRFAGVGSVVVGMMAGSVQSESVMIERVETASGQAMLFNAADAAFWWSLGLLGVAMVLMMYATWDAGGRS